MATWLRRQVSAPAARHHEDLARGEQEFGRKGLVLRGRGALAALALVGELLEALRQAPADRLLPCARINQ